MAEIDITQKWNGSGIHGEYFNYYLAGSNWDPRNTEISYTQNKNTRTSTVTLTNNLGYTSTAIFSEADKLTNQKYTVKLGNVTRTGTIGNLNIDWSVFPKIRISVPNLTYTVSHIEEVSVPYSLTYTATVQCDQRNDIYGQPDYRTFTVTVTYSGSVILPRYNTLYGSVYGTSRPIKKLYGSVNGKARNITKLYGSVNGKSKRIF